MRSESPSSDLRLAALAVELMSPAKGRARRLDLQEGARRAIDLRLAGIFRMGLQERRAADTGTGPLADALRRAERMEAPTTRRPPGRRWRRFVFFRARGFPRWS